MKNINLLNQIKNPTVQALSKLLSGTALAQLIPIIVTPVLTRMYDAQAFGAFSVFIGISSVISISAALRYDLAIPQAKNEIEARQLFFLCLLIVTGIGLTLAACAGAAHKILYNIFENETFESAGFFYLLAIAFLGAGLIQICVNGFIRRSDFSSIAVSKIVVAASYAVTQTILGVVNAAGGLVLGYVAGQVMGAVYTLKKSAAWIPTEIKKSDFSDLKRNMREYRQLPLYSAPSAAIDAFCSALPVLIIGANYDLATAGMYGLAQRLLGAPAAFFSLSISQIIFQKVASDAGYKENYIRNLIIRCLALLSTVIIPFLITISLYGPEIFAHVFGEEWKTAGDYAAILIFGVAVQLLVGPSSLVLALKENIKLGSAWQITRLITLSCTLLYAKQFDFESFLWVFVLHEMFIYLLYLRLIFIGAQRRVANKSHHNKKEEKCRS